MKHDVDGVIRSYLNAIADGLVFDLGEEPADVFKGDEDFDEIINFALDREGDAILFFLGVKEFLDSKEDKDIIDELIQEEITHIAWLKEQRDKINAR